MLTALSDKQFQVWTTPLLVSVLNQQLRDEFSTLADLCRCHDLSESMVSARLNDRQLYYDATLNRIVEQCATPF